MGVHKLCVELRSADPQDDPEVIRGVLRELFNKMPQGMRAMKIADQLYANDMAYAHTLARLEESVLESLGISMGAAMWALSLIREEEESTADVEPDQTSTGPAERRTTKQPELRKFPAAGADGWPSLKGWSAYEAGYALYVESEVSQEAGVCVRKVNAGAGFQLPEDWQTGGQDDVVLSRALINGGGGMPEATLLLIPKALRDKQAGLAMYSHIKQQVKQRSDAAAGVLQGWFTTPPRLAEKNKHMLGAVYQEWDRDGRQRHWNWRS